MKTIFDDEWKFWIWDNVHRQCSKEGIFEILLNNDFDPMLIEKELSYQPQSKNVKELYNKKLLNNTNDSKKNSSDNQSNFKHLNNVLSKEEYKNLDNLNFLGAQRVETDKVNIWTKENFLSDEECDLLIEKAKGRYQKSKITTEEIEKDKLYRTSNTGHYDENDPFIKEINEKISNYIGIELKKSEAIQSQWYQPNQEFKQHTDYFESGTEEYQRFAQELGNRTWTFMIYLSNVEEGGETEFVRINKSFKPLKGMAVIWNNLKEDGTPNIDTMHWGKKVIKGNKHIITKWFREKSL